MSHSTKYLYNLDPHVLKNMNYEKAIKYKIKKAKQLLTDVLLVPHFMKRDTQRINSVHKAIKFNLSLLKELQC